MNTLDEHGVAGARVGLNDLVRVRWQQRRGEVGRVVQQQPAGVFRVRFADGQELFYGRDGIERCLESPAAPGPV